MNSSELRITPLNREIIDYTARSQPLSEEQQAKLEVFSALDDEWRMLLAAGNRYPGSEERLAELDQQREQYLNGQTEPTVAAAIKEYLRQVEVAQFENEP